MKRLKNILHYNILYYVFLFIVLLITIYRINDNHRSIYNKNTKQVTGLIEQIKIDNNMLSITLSSREKIIGYYYISDKLEQEKLKKSIYIGDKVKIIGKFNKIKNMDSTFNYQTYMNKKNIYYSVKINKMYLISKNKNIFYYIKNKAIKRCLNNGYLYTFILGDKSKLNTDIITTYQNLGVSHLFAISGMHISLISTVLLFLLRRVKYRYSIVIIFLILYLFLTGISPSILRAVILFILIYINKKLSLEVKIINIFIATFCISLIINPLFLTEISFQYSFLISFSLICMNNYINNYNSYLKKILITSFISNIVSIPITLYNFNQFNFFSILYNIFYIPLISIIIFPLAIITFIIPILLPLFIFFTQILEKISVFLDKLSFSILIFKNINIFFYFLYLFLIFLFLCGLYSKDKRLYVPLIVMLFMHYTTSYYYTNNYLVMLDVGQGDSFVIHLNKKNIMIDTGGINNYYNKNYNISKKYIPLLKKLGIRNLNYLILSHGDYDHMGESINLVNNFKVEKVIFNCGPYNDLEKELIKVLNKKKIKYYTCVRELNVDKYKLNFLQTKEFDNENDNSNVIYTNIDGVKMMFMGDAGVNTEKEIVNKYNLPDIDVLKVGHHGSKTSSGKEFVNEINPKYSIISVGKNNRYGHPNKEVLDNLNDSKVYRTDKDGSIMFKIKNNKLQVETCSP